MTAELSVEFNHVVAGGDAGDENLCWSTGDHNLLRQIVCLAVTERSAHQITVLVGVFQIDFLRPFLPLSSAHVLHVPLSCVPTLPV